MCVKSRGDCLRVEHVLVKFLVILDASCDMENIEHLGSSSTKYDNSEHDNDKHGGLQRRGIFAINTGTECKSNGTTQPSPE